MTAKISFSDFRDYFEPEICSIMYSGKQLDVTILFFELFDSYKSFRSSISEADECGEFTSESFLRLFNQLIDLLVAEKKLERQENKIIRPHDQIDFVVRESMPSIVYLKNLSLHCSTLAQEFLEAANNKQNGKALKLRGKILDLWQEIEKVNWELRRV